LIASADAAAATSTTMVVAAAGDEVSAAIASLFSGHGQAYQSMSAQAAAFNQQFVQALNGAGFSYADGEAAGAASLQTIGQDLLGVVNTPTDLLLGRPLIGDGTNGTPGTGQERRGGGLLFGNGGQRRGPASPGSRAAGAVG